MKVEIYSDISCPWCYIGHVRLERALGTLASPESVEVIHRPYQLDPDAPASGVPIQQYLEGRYGPRAGAMLEHAAGAAKAEGLEINWDGALAANTLDAHRLLRMAGDDYGAAVAHALLLKLFAAHFTHGCDVSNHEQLVGLAASVGMNVARVRALLATAEYRAEVMEEVAQAHRIGVRAVPTFVFDGANVIQGAQPVSAFVAMLGEVQRPYPASTALEGDEACADGSCAVTT
ncbi:MAG TPA: DsbA family oxidoreductase [Gemmatimonadales bacterium]|nr:DsbA family oxidoreductase [Gemmatimonadales bacterium]